MRGWFTVFVGLAACSGEDAIDSAGGGATSGEEQPAALTEPSGGCPTFGASGEVVTITSDGLERNVTVVYPDEPVAGMPLLFTWHGLTTPAYDPIGSTVLGFGLQAEANERKVIFVVPESRTMDLSMMGTVSLWGILDDEEPDLVLYDDLRACVAEQFDVDLRRVGSWGHSGGALWTTAVAQNRPDTLAAFAEISGGSDLEIPMLGGPYLDWDPVGRDLPSVLITGGEGDVWPDPTLTLIDFTAATESLTQALVDEGQVVGRCVHAQGHFSIPPKLVTVALDWLTDHTFGEPSEYADGGNLDPDCWWPATGETAP